MIEVFTRDQFKVMPWKNGGGLTTELYCSLNSSFRLSIATVNSNGPFSQFPGKDRILLLLKGDGFRLDMENQKNVTLSQPLKPIYFPGEESINCTLLGSSSLDFNVMTDRNYGTSELSITSSTKDHVIEIVAKSDFKFIYDIQNEVLFKLDLNDTYNLKTSNHDHFIIIDVSLKKL